MLDFSFRHRFGLMPRAAGVHVKITIPILVRVSIAQ